MDGKVSCEGWKQAPVKNKDDARQVSLRKSRKTGGEIESHVAAIPLQSLLQLQNSDLLLSLVDRLASRCGEVHHSGHKHGQALDRVFG